MFRGRYQGSLLNCFVTNISKKELRYSFQSAAVQKIHPTRTLSQGTDRLFLTSNLIALADHGQISGPNQLAYLEQGFTLQILKIIKYFYLKDPQHYHQNLMKLVQQAVTRTRQFGSCTLTLASIHPETGDVNFYYIGDSVYGIFRAQKIQLVEGLYSGGFNNAIRVSNNEQFFPKDGYLQSYPKADIKKDDVIVIGSNGLWNNLDLNAIHYYVRGPGSFLEEKKKYSDAVGTKKKESKSLKEIADKLGNLAGLFSKRGNYESPLYRRARKQGVQFPKEGLLDDVTVILARRKKELVISRSNSQSSESDLR